MYKTFGSWHDISPVERQADLILFIEQFCKLHPWFELVEVRNYSESQDGRRYFHVLSCYEQDNSIPADIAIFFRPTRACDWPGDYAFLLALEDKSNSVNMVRLDRADVVESFDLYSDAAHPQYQIIQHFFAVYDRSLVKERRSRTFYETRSNYQKALNKAALRFGAERPKQFRDPAFYPPGTVVQIWRSFNLSGSPYTVQSVSTNGPDSTLIRLNATQTSLFDHGRIQVCVNAGLVEKILKRGSGPGPKHSSAIEALLSTLDRAKLVFDRGRTALLHGPESEVLVHQKKLYRAVSTKLLKACARFWTVQSPIDFVQSYIEAYCAVGFRFQYQFDTDLFLSRVLHDHDWHTARIDKKKFRREIKRLNCYLEPLKKAIEEDELENMRYSEDLDLLP